MSKIFKTVPRALLIESDMDFGLLAAQKITLEILGFKHKDKIERHVHPDVNILIKNKTEGSILINDIRTIIKFAYLKPVEANSKIYVIGADKLSIQAQNSLLKILEEPPENVYFIFICENLKRLIPTVLSRLAILRKDLIKNINFEKKVNKINDEISQKISDLIFENNEYEVLKLISGYTKNKENLKEILTLTRNKIITNMSFDKKLVLVLQNFLKATELIDNNINLNLICCFLF